MVAHEPRLNLGIGISPSFMQLDKYGGSFWEDAACKNSGDPDAWFIDYSTGDEDELWRLNNALRICETCPIKDKCLEAGLTGDDLKWGIWGGLFPGERQQLASKSGFKLQHRFKQSLINAQTLRKRLAQLKARANSAHNSEGSVK